MTALALAVASNVSFADEDPLADPHPDDVPKAELSLFCVLPAFQSNGNNGTDGSPGRPCERLEDCATGTRTPLTI